MRRWSVGRLPAGGGEGSDRPPPITPSALGPWGGVALTGGDAGSGGAVSAAGHSERAVSAVSVTAVCASVGARSSTVARRSGGSGRRAGLREIRFGACGAGWDARLGGVGSGDGVAGATSGEDARC